MLVTYLNRTPRIQPAAYNGYPENCTASLDWPAGMLSAVRVLA
jgi:hypothetical protein